MNVKKPESIVLRFVWLESLTQDYSDPEIGKIVRDLYLYAKEGAEPSQYDDRGMRSLWRSMKDGVDKDVAKYQKKSRQATEAINARWSKAQKEIPPNTDVSDGIRSYPTYTHTSTDTVTPTSPPAAPDPRTDTGLAAIIQHFQEAIGDFPRSALDKLQRWREVYPTELICKAIDEAAENGKRSWAYTEGILKSWQADGVRTLGDVEARRESRKKPGKLPETAWKDFT